MSRRLAGTFASLVLLLSAVVLAFTGGGGGEARVAAAPRIVNLGELEELEDELGHAVYWAGPRPHFSLELHEETEGSVYLRFLPAGTAAGDNRESFLTVGTYPVPAAQSAVRRAAAAEHARVVSLGGGAIAFDNSHGSAYLAYPGSNLQIEVYSPQPGKAMQLVRSGAIEAVGG